MNIIIEPLSIAAVWSLVIGLLWLDGNVSDARRVPYLDNGREGSITIG